MGVNKVVGRKTIKPRGRPSSAQQILGAEARTSHPRWLQEAATACSSLGEGKGLASVGINVNPNGYMESWRELELENPGGWNRDQRGQ